MKIHEYQARELLADAGIPVPEGRVAKTVEQAVEAATAIFGEGAHQVVVKAQVHAGGRGKAGFVKVVDSVEAVKEAATFMLNNKMVSVQTGPEGLDVTTLLVAAAVDIDRELYLAITTDRAQRTNTVIASSEGGVEIETVAHERPDAIIKMPTHPLDGLQPWQARQIAFSLGLKGKQISQAVKIMVNLSRLQVRTDASLVEINPLIITPPSDEFPDGEVMAIDAKFNFDDNALYRQKKVQTYYDPTEEDPNELRASKAGLNFVALDGNIGCLVNGAGLAMSTMDIIKLHGGDPANFLDVGGDASLEAITEAFRIILGEDKVEGVLVNIFGGIMQCDRVASAIVSAAKEVGFTVPLVVRLEGTNVEEARRILEEAQSELPTMQTADDLGDAAKKVTSAVVAA
ncbi:MAG: ADP-forming succinate--CoA ligase subunit beta [Phycisphaerales bacterium]|nr:ADP-forming succinate--CoA ligase subunit beta [Phycisphaerales bacterium]